MVSLAKLVILIFWILDITNMPFMEIFDTTYPLNEEFWALIWIFVFFLFESGGGKDDST